MRDEEKQKGFPIVFGLYFFSHPLCLVNFIFLPGYEIAGDKSGLHICPSVEKHLSGLWCYRASWKTGCHIYQFGDFVVEW